MVQDYIIKNIKILKRDNCFSDLDMEYLIRKYSKYIKAINKNKNIMIFDKVASRWGNILDFRL